MKSQSRDAARRYVQSELEAVDEERSSEMMFVAAVTAAACVARADGWVDTTERDRLVDWMGETGLLDGFSAREAAESFDLRVRQFEDAEGIDLAVASLRRACGHPRARLIVACAEQIARADGEVRHSEEMIVALIRRSVANTPAIGAAF